MNNKYNKQSAWVGVMHNGQNVYGFGSFWRQIMHSSYLGVCSWCMLLLD